MKPKHIFIFLLAVVLVLPLAAKNKDIFLHDNVEEHIMHIEKFTNPLNLTDEQEKSFKKLDLEFKKETLATRNELEIKELELQAELEEDNPNEKKIYALVDDIHGLKAKLEKKEIATRLKKRALLDDEQKASFDKMRFGHKNIIIRKGDLDEDIDILMDHHGLKHPDGARIKIEKKILK